MKNFKDFGIKAQSKAFEGDKIPMHKILNKEIVVHDYKCGASNYKDKGSGQLLTLQIVVDGVKRVVFTGSGSLIEMIDQVPKEEFPFTTTIIKENGRNEFT